MKRIYGVDVLKMMAMLMVVMLHVMERGGVFGACAEDARSLNFACFKVFYSACRCAVDCFVLATGYVMCRHTFKYSRIFKLWAEVVFYAAGMLLVAKCFFPTIEIGYKTVLQAVMPVSFDTYWFFTDYVGLFFCIPFLNRLLASLDKKTSWQMVSFGFVVWSVFASLSGNDIFNLNEGYSLVWFIYLYLVAGTISLHGVPAFVTSLLAAGLFGSSAMMTTVLCFLGDHVNRRWGVFGGCWGSYASPFVLIEAVSLLVICMRLEIKNGTLQRIIAFVAPSVFSVYILHSNPLFREMVQWNGKFAFLGHYPLPLMLAGIFACAALIFVACIGIDCVRRVVARKLRSWLGMQ